MDVTECNGYKKLLAAVERDEERSPGFHDYRGKLQWAVDRAQHYAEATGISAAEILDAWEDSRNYWYMNYYQDANQQELAGDGVRVFSNIDDFRQSVGDVGFRCPACGGVSRSPYECDSDRQKADGEICNWKSYGFLGTLDKGVHVFVKEKMIGQTIFQPIAWEATA